MARGHESRPRHPPQPAHWVRSTIACRTEWRSSRGRSCWRRSGPRQLTGVVWEPERLPTGEVGDNRLRPLLGAYDLPPLAEPLRRLIEWTADYYLAPIAAVLRMTLASASALDGGRTRHRISRHRHRARAADAAARPGAGADRRPPGAGARARAGRGRFRRSHPRPGQGRRDRGGRGLGRRSLSRCPIPIMRRLRSSRRSRPRRASSCGRSRRPSSRPSCSTE